jgi:REP element-mobilizing transposase RayT
VLTVGAMPAILLDAIRSTSAGRPIKTHAWCVMPDHMHAVVAPTPGGDVVDWVQAFKGSVAADARRLGLRGLWQRSFHDRAVRSDEAICDVIRYVLANPVRAGLVPHWRQWPHHGSLTLDLSTLTDL